MRFIIGLFCKFTSKRNISAIFPANGLFLQKRYRQVFHPANALCVLVCDSDCPFMPQNTAPT